MKVARHASLLLFVAACGYESGVSSNLKKTDNKLPYYLQLSYNVCIAHGFKTEFELRRCAIEDATMNCRVHNFDFPICDQLLGKSDEPFIWPV